MRSKLLPLLATAVALAGCGSGLQLLHRNGTTTTFEIVAAAGTPQAGQKLGFPSLATKNTTRVGGADAVADAAAVALAVYPSVAPGTHPAAVAIAPTDNWEAALAASVLMSRPVRAPVLLSDGSGLPSATADTLSALAPTGSGAAGGAQVIRVGDVPSLSGVRTASISGHGPYALPAAIDRFASAAAGRPSSDVVIASSADPAYAMPAAGWAAESGDPLLFVTSSGIPQATRQALLSHGHPNIYVLGPRSVIPRSVAQQLRAYGAVKRIDPGAPDPAANSVAFAIYRDPPCAFGQPCVHVPGSFGWALRSPGHGYTLISAARPLDAAASAALSASGDYGPQLVIANNSSTLPSAVESFFLNYATPGYTQEGPTAAVYNHGWIIGDQTAISVAMQGQTDRLLEVVPPQR
jgi:hypothetical protein